MPTHTHTVESLGQLRYQSFKINIPRKDNPKNQITKNGRVTKVLEGMVPGSLEDDVVDEAVLQ